MTATDRPTFERLAALEPGLVTLERDVRAATAYWGRKRNRCGNGVWYGFGRYGPGFKGRLVALVGWSRHRHRKPLADPAAEALLRGDRAYAAAYEHLYRLVPDCRNCACL